MSDIVLKVENLSKQYRLGLTGTGTLRDDLNRFFAKIRGKEDPTLKVGETNSLETIEGEYVWALRDINFEVKKGEVLGIIGKNGAGKSTLLKILSKTTSPTTGVVKTKGRVASLLEVGTGMHPELTGRENIFLNGAILGMNKVEIRKKLDEIIDFAGIAKYVDTPIKRYSSGMNVRLGFAVAAFLEPEILIVDEVLAVGDAEFQKKAIGKMQDVSQGEGRTVLFVSHNMNSITTLCSQGILLKRGSIAKQGDVNEIVKSYINTENTSQTTKDWSQNPIGDKSAKLISAKLINEKYESINNVLINQRVGIQFTYKVLDKNTEKIPNIHLFNGNLERVFISSAESTSINSKKANYTATVWIPANLLNTGTYIIGIALSTMSPVQVHFFVQDAIVFEAIEDIQNRNSDYNQEIPGFIRPKLEWELKTLFN